MMTYHVVDEANLQVRSDCQQKLYARIPESAEREALHQFKLWICDDLAF